MAHSGGLIAYGTDSVSPYRRAAGYVDRILKGEKSADGHRSTSQRPCLNLTPNPFKWAGLDRYDVMT